MNAVVRADAPTPLALYDQMCTAIAECSRVDEAKDIRDKAMALEAYYRQARNLDAEREAANVRLRAERRVGELLKDLARAESGAARNPTGRAGKQPMSAPVTQVPSPYAAALKDQGISRQAASRFQAVANIPAAQFEQALAGPEKATTASVVARAKVQAAGYSPTVMNAKGLWLWGRLRDLENDGFLEIGPAEILTNITDAMRADIARLAPVAADFLSGLGARS